MSMDECQLLTHSATLTGHRLPEHSCGADRPDGERGAGPSRGLHEREPARTLGARSYLLDSGVFSMPGECQLMTW